MPEEAKIMMDDAASSAGPDSDNENAESSLPDRRELIKKLGKAAVLPALVTSIIGSGITDASAY
jgi:hypothetical protein